MAGGGGRPALEAEALPVSGIALTVVGVCARRQIVAPVGAGAVAARVGGPDPGQTQGGQEDGGQAAGQAVERLAAREPPRQLLGQRVEVERCAVSFVAKARRFSCREMSQRELSEAKARNGPMQGQRSTLR